MDDKTETDENAAHKRHRQDDRRARAVPGIRTAPARINGKAILLACLVFSSLAGASGALLISGNFSAWIATGANNYAQHNTTKNNLYQPYLNRPYTYTPTQDVPLTITTQPTNADAYVNNHYAGKTPTTYNTAPGNADVWIRKDGYASYESNIQVGGTSANIQITLAKEASGIASKPLPVDALSDATGFEQGFNINDANALIRGNDNNLYVAYTQPLIHHNNDVRSTQLSGAVAIGVALSTDNGKTWSYAGGQTAFPQDTPTTTVPWSLKREYSYFEGIAPAPDGGALVYYSIFEDPYYNPGSSACSTNQPARYEFHALHVTPEQTTDTKIATPAGDYLKFLGTNGTAYLFDNEPAYHASLNGYPPSYLGLNPEIPLGKEVAAMYESEDGVILKSTGGYFANATFQPKKSGVYGYCGVSGTPPQLIKIVDPNTGYSYDPTLQGFDITCPLDSPYYVGGGPTTGGTLVTTSTSHFLGYCGGPNHCSTNPACTGGPYCTCISLKETSDFPPSAFIYGPGAPPLVPYVQKFPPIPSQAQPLDQVWFSPFGKRFGLKHESSYNAGKFANNDTLYIQNGPYFQYVASPFQQIYNTLQNEFPNAYSITPLGIPQGVFDAQGNLHMAYTWSITDSTKARSGRTYYQMIPASGLDPENAQKHDAVYIFTEPDCTDCDKVKQYLSDSGIPYVENPDSETIKQAAQSAISSTGYPLTLIQDGEEFRTVQGWDRAQLAEEIGIEIKPELALSNSIGAATGPSAPADVFGYLTPILIVRTDGEPEIMYETNQNLMKSTWQDRSWVQNSLFPLASNKQDKTTTTQYNYLVENTGYAAIQTIPAIIRSYPPIQDENDFELLQRNASHDLPNLPNTIYAASPVYPRIQEFNYYAIRSNRYQQEQTVTQLIPAAVYLIPLDESTDQTPTYTGDLQELITEQGTTTQDGQTYYRIKVDLNKANIKAQNSQLEAQQYTGTAAIGDAYAHLVLNVENRPFQAANPVSADDSVSLALQSAQGPDGDWVIANNLGVPNNLDCDGADIEIKAHGTKYLTPSQVTDVQAACLSSIQTSVEAVGTDEQYQFLLQQQQAEILKANGATLSDQATEYENAYGSDQQVIYIPLTPDTWRPQDRSGGPTPSLPSDKLLVLKYAGNIYSSDGSDYKPEITPIDASQSPT